MSCTLFLATMVPTTMLRWSRILSSVYHSSKCCSRVSNSLCRFSAHQQSASAIQSPAPICYHYLMRANGLDEDPRCCKCQDFTQQTVSDKGVGDNSPVHVMPGKDTYPIDEQLEQDVMHASTTHIITGANVSKKSLASQKTRAHHEIPASTTNVASRNVSKKSIPSQHKRDNASKKSVVNKETNSTHPENTTRSILCVPENSTKSTQALPNGAFSQTVEERDAGSIRSSNLSGSEHEKELSDTGPEHHDFYSNSVSAMRPSESNRVEVMTKANAAKSSLIMGNLESTENAEMPPCFQQKVPTCCVYKKIRSMLKLPAQVLGQIREERSSLHDVDNYQIIEEEPDCPCIELLTNMINLANDDTTQTSLEQEEHKKIYSSLIESAQVTPYENKLPTTSKAGIHQTASVQFKEMPYSDGSLSEYSKASVQFKRKHMSEYIHESMKKASNVCIDQFQTLPLLISKVSNLTILSKNSTPQKQKHQSASLDDDDPSIGPPDLSYKSADTLGISAELSSRGLTYEEEVNEKASRQQSPTQSKEGVITCYSDISNVSNINAFVPDGTILADTTSSHKIYNKTDPAWTLTDSIDANAFSTSNLQENIDDGIDGADNNTYKDTGQNSMRLIPIFSDNRISVGNEINKYASASKYVVHNGALKSQVAVRHESRRDVDHTQHADFGRVESQKDDINHIQHEKSQQPLRHADAAEQSNHAYSQRFSRLVSQKDDINQIEDAESQEPFQYETDRGEAELSKHANSQILGRLVSQTDDINQIEHAESQEHFKHEVEKHHADRSHVAYSQVFGRLESQRDDINQIQHAQSQESLNADKMDTEQRQQCICPIDTDDDDGCVTTSDSNITIDIKILIPNNKQKQCVRFYGPQRVAASKLNSNK